MIERVQAAFDWLPPDLVNTLFWICVDIMKWMCGVTGASYEGAKHMAVRDYTASHDCLVLCALGAGSKVCTYYAHRASLS